MPAPKKIDHEEFERLHNDGWTINELAAHYDVNPRTVSRVRSRLGLAGKPNMIPMTDDRLAKIRAMIEDGAPHAEISRTLHVDHHTLTKYFPGTAWTREQRAEYSSVLRTINPHFNRRPRTYNKSKYQAA